MKRLTNIELFNGVAGELFALLYQKFPLYVDVDFNALGNELVDKDDFETAYNMSEFAEATVRWLAATGYIYLKDPQEFGGSFNAVLSPKGFEVLKAMPEAIDKGKTLGEKIVELAKSGASAGLSKVVDLAFSLGIKAATGNLESSL